MTEKNKQPLLQNISWQVQQTRAVGSHHGRFPLLAEGKWSQTTQTTRPVCISRRNSHVFPFQVARAICLGFFLSL